MKLAASLTWVAVPGLGKAFSENGAKVGSMTVQAEKLSSESAPLTDAERAARLAQLFREHSSFVFRVVRRLGARPGDVEDLVQDVFVTAHRRLEDFDGTFPAAWLFRIATGTVANYRRLARHKTESGERISTASDPRNDIERDALRAELDLALDSLRDEERQVFLLYEYEEMTMSEVCAIVGCPEQTGYSRLKSARAKLRSFIEERTREGKGGL